MPNKCAGLPLMVEQGQSSATMLSQTSSYDTGEPATNLQNAVHSEDVREACAILAYVHEAMMALDRVSPQVLEVLRDEFDPVAEERGGPRGALKRAWRDYIQQEIDGLPLEDTLVLMYERRRA
jgi:hypothetical protein